MLQQAGAMDAEKLDAKEAVTLWEKQVAFADETADDGKSPIVLQIAVPPSAVTKAIADVLVSDSECEIQAYAANGIVLARFCNFGQSEVSTVLTAKLRPEAVQLGGSIVVVRRKLEGLTPHLIWGGRTDALVLLEKIKEKFDPDKILNPGRFIL
jgi:FAD/FMN-containing dehydrogenase